MTAFDTPLVEILVSWQNEARDLLAPLAPRLHREGVLPADELAARNDAIRQLRWTMIPRETRKQRFLWPSIRQHFYPDTRRYDGAPVTRDGAEVVDELRQCKLVFEQVLIRLRWADDRSQDFERQLGTLIVEIRSYLELEENLLPRIASQLPVAEQERVAERLTARAGLLPVQAHPDLPAVPWLAGVLAPLAGLADRFRDRFTTAPG